MKQLTGLICFLCLLCSCREEAGRGVEQPMSQPIVSETASPDSMEVEEILPFERKPLTAADIIAPTSMNGIVCNMSPAAPVPMRTSGIGRPRDSNMADAAMRNATSGVPMMRKR